MKIEFGGGENPKRPDWKQCDVRKLPNIDYVCDAWRINEFIERNKVDEIYSRHFFEHLTFEQGQYTLIAWRDILKPNGRLEIIVPDMDFHIKQWTTGSDMDHAKAGFWGWQRGNFLDIWDIHKSGYNFKTLKELLEKYMFTDVERLTYKEGHLGVICNAPK